MNLTDTSRSGAIAVRIDPEGSIAFSGCVPGKGVASVVIASAGATAGRVNDVTPCPATTG